MLFINRLAKITDDPVVQRGRPVIIIGVGRSRNLVGVACPASTTIMKLPAYIVIGRLICSGCLAQRPRQGFL
jgi:hypothetical protein